MHCFTILAIVAAASALPPPHDSSSAQEGLQMMKLPAQDNIQPYKSVGQMITSADIIHDWFEVPLVKSHEPELAAIQDIIMQSSISAPPNRHLAGVWNFRISEILTAELKKVFGGLTLAELREVIQLLGTRAASIQKKISDFFADPRVKRILDDGKDAVDKIADAIGIVKKFIVDIVAIANDIKDAIAQASAKGRNQELGAESGPTPVGQKIDGYIESGTRSAHPGHQITDIYRNLSKESETDLSRGTKAASRVVPSLPGRRCFQSCNRVSPITRCTMTCDFFA